MYYNWDWLTEFRRKGELNGFYPTSSGDLKWVLGGLAHFESILDPFKNLFITWIIM